MAGFLCNAGRRGVFYTPLFFFDFDTTPDITPFAFKVTKSDEVKKLDF